MQAYRLALVRRFGPSSIQFRAHSASATPRKADSWGDVVIPSRHEVREKQRLAFSDFVAGAKPKTLSNNAESQNNESQASPTPQQPILKWSPRPRIDPQPAKPSTTQLDLNDLPPSTSASAAPEAGMQPNVWDNAVSKLPGRKASYFEGSSWTPSGHVVERAKGPQRSPRAGGQTRGGPNRIGQMRAEGRPSRGGRASGSAGRGRGIREQGGKRAGGRKRKDDDWEDDEAINLDEPEPDFGTSVSPMHLLQPSIIGPLPVAGGKNLLGVPATQAAAVVAGSGTSLSEFVRDASPRRILRRYGGDYSHCTLKTSKTAVKDLTSLQLARLALGKRPDVEFTKRGVAAGIIKSTTSSTKPTVQAN
ncbi:hypothetical protein Moror_16446 [Moniliophthora roreri MCA 2997]|uniref:Uncharacterized protein n=1 Tax=Moniliophthora roreri (strain MCA 2997) TaxID=1381753 RepID=V2XEJ9_MONRO|nr:hypothetical protein Moror_16446 [Moniliophthora roreri MCA 2997]